MNDKNLTPAKPKKIRYQTKTVRMSAYRPRKINKYLRAGWEVVSTVGGSLGTVQTVTLRRQKN